MTGTLGFILCCTLLFSSCASMPSGTARQLAAGISKHAFHVRKAVLLGDGVSPEVATRAAQGSGAMVLYCPSRGQRSSSFVPDIKTSLRAIASSGDIWEIAVAERARGQFLVILKSMRSQELATFRGRLVLSAAARSDVQLQEQLRRVFGEQVAIEYI